MKTATIVQGEELRAFLGASLGADTFETVNLEG